MSTGGGIFIICASAVVETGALGFFLAQAISKNSRVLASQLTKYKKHLEEQQGIKGRFDEVVSKLVPLPQLGELVKRLKRCREEVKADRGRVTITQAELETVENRLRELEEIERELQASGLETKEELKILKKKEKDLASKNEALKQQIAASNEQLVALFGEMELSSQIIEQVERMKGELAATLSKIDILLVQIEQGNDQYVILKQRYDALDIEYAQLYEKFSEAEGSR